MDTYEFVREYWEGITVLGVLTAGVVYNVLRGRRDYEQMNEQQKRDLRDEIRRDEDPRSQ
ncbi:MAG: hypothetical protein ABIH92_02805 [Nanoarchaeota archaeon]